MSKGVGPPGGTEMNKQQLIISILKTRLKDAHKRYLTARSEHAGAIAAHNVWEQYHPEDGVGFTSMNPYNIGQASTREMDLRVAFANLQEAYEYAVEQFIKDRRYTVRVFDDHSGDVHGAAHEDDRIYNVPGDTESDARVLAFILDKGVENEKYGSGSTIEDGDVALAKTYTEVIEVKE